jgi:endonuclease YncB( thermonuclease family)
MVAAVGILRSLFRALFPKPKARRRVVRYESGSLADRLAQRAHQTARRGPEVLIVEPREIMGRCWVIDGDTIDITGTRIRLAGIDAPELDDPFGQVAKAALMRLCKGMVIRAVTDGDLSYDRVVATCYLPDGRDLSAELVKAGLAIDWPKFSRGKYRHLEPEGIRKKLWRCDARQKGLGPASLPD